MADDKQDRTVVRAMVSDQHERSRVITVEEIPGDEIVSVVVSDGSSRASSLVITLCLDSDIAREIGQALIEAADGLEAEERR